jgi:hypothetical protein
MSYRKYNRILRAISISYVFLQVPFSGILYLAGYYVYLAGCYENIISRKRKSGKHTEAVNQPKNEGDLENTRKFLRCSM